MVEHRNRIPLSKSHPELLPEWHPTRNGDLSPDQVTQGSNTKVWWACTNGPDHEWQAAIHSRSSGRGCPFCRGLRVSVTNSLHTLHPELVAQWHPAKNGDLTPEMFASGTRQTAWWKCINGPDHEWQAQIGSRTTGGSAGLPNPEPDRRLDRASNARTRVPGRAIAFARHPQQTHVRG